MASRTGSETVTVSGTDLSTTPADLYTDAAWASQSGATLADGQNTWTAKIVDYGVTNQQVVTGYMPASANYGYYGNGNLTNDGLRSFEYDFENQLTNIYVASGWRSEFRYDGLGRRRVRREYTWSVSGKTGARLTTPVSPRFGLDSPSRLARLPVGGK